MPAPDLTQLLALGLAGYVLLTSARRRWAWVLGGLALTSPGLRWLAALFSFPLRLEQSRWVGAVLRLAGADAEVRGNVIRLNGTDFAVDPACMGLQLMGLSLLAGLFLLIHTENESGKKLPFPALLLAGFCLTIWAVSANFFRMLVLVWFAVLPDNPFHDVFGLVCWLAYVALPLGWLIPKLYHRFGRPAAVAAGGRWWLLPALLSLMLVAGFVWLPRQEGERTEPVAMPGYVVRKLENGFVQYSKTGVLVYVKPVRTVWATEHNPYVCWRGSGYEFGRVEEGRLNGQPLYRGQLSRGGHTLHTAWWFSNGREITTSQLRFRHRMLQGERAFWLINVTVDQARDEAAVYQEWQHFRNGLP
ncbi:exosortase N [Tellurirhabdus rosea]|uniref:exosortase N n=1 Tax=Tellurirhabdus rosea TaxID=2674997 RepID=UPI00224D107C|nr:exosortase N [Tellurirhabdus rosea]